MPSYAERGQEIFNENIPTKMTQRQKLLWLQRNRTSGTWARCSLPNCLKWRYLKNIFDPIDIPNEWQCSMNPYSKYNSCSQEETPLFKDINLIKLKYAAGSLVWVRSHRYTQWPGMVDDDPELAQFYWWKMVDNEKVADMYHVVFIDKGARDVSRQWFADHELEPFTLKNAEITSAKSQRFVESVRVTREALSMNIFQRLQRFSFARLFRGHIFSCGYKFRSFLLDQGCSPDSDSDHTILSSSSSESDDDYNKTVKNERVSSKRNHHSRKDARPNGADRQSNAEKREIKKITPVTPETSRSRRSSSVSLSTSRKRAVSVSRSDSEKSEIKRISSVTPETSRSTRSSLVAPSYSIPRKQAASVCRGNSEKRKSKRISSVTPETSRSTRSSSVALSSSTPRMQSASVGHSNFEKKESKRISSVAPETSRSTRSSSVALPLSTPRMRAASVCHGDYSETNFRKKKSSSVARDDYSSLSYSRNGVSGSSRDCSETKSRKSCSVAPEVYSSPSYSKNGDLGTSNNAGNYSRSRRSTSAAPNADFKNSSKRKRSSVGPENFTFGMCLRSRASCEDETDCNNIVGERNSGVPHGNSILNDHIPEGGMIRKTVVKVKTKNWKLIEEQEKLWRDLFFNEHRKF